MAYRDGPRADARAAAALQKVETVGDGTTSESRAATPLAAARAFPPSHNRRAV